MRGGYPGLLTTPGIGKTNKTIFLKRDCVHKQQLKLQLKEAQDKVTNIYIIYLFNYFLKAI